MAHRRRVLIIEDSPTQAFRLKSLLESPELECLIAPSGEEALDILERTRPDVIVLDYHLPGMNGDAFCRQVKQNLNTRAIPVLMLTVEHSDIAQMRGLESGADDYLQKSADPDILLMRVRNLLRRSEAGERIVDVSTRFSRARVLAIDDSPTYLEFLKRELKGERYELELASSGEEGIERLESKNFDCVLIDFEMPGMNGAEVCRRITHFRSKPGSEIVVVMLTSHDDKEHQTLALEAGADDFIPKSADVEVIKARIRALLRRKFLIEENRRLLDEFRERDLEAERARAERAAAELRATLADQLAAANRELEIANRKLEEALDVTRAITDNAAEALVVVNLERQVTFLNPAAEAMFGFGGEELLGQTLDGKLLPLAPNGNVRHGEDDPLAKCLSEGLTLKGTDALFVRRDGARIEMACSYSPIVQDGRVKAAVLVLHDLSERKRAEERLREAQKLESIGLLAGGIAHDFNNLLTGIIGNASLAIEIMPRNEGAVELLQDVVTAGERAADLTRQMLAYSGKGRFVVEPVNLSHLAAEMTRLLQATTSKNVVLDLDLLESLPDVEADAGQMQQVIMNLVLNAAEAIGDEPGKVEVKTRVQWIDDPLQDRLLNAAEITPGRYVCLEVRDTGPGMDEQTKTRIFDPFFTTKFAGRGLGLAAVAGIVRGHRGAIRLTTAPGEGTTFEVFFPALKTSRIPVKDQKTSVENDHGAHMILIVDDEEVVRSVAGSTLAHHGYRVRLASGGQEGIEVVQDERGMIALVILDLTMPGLSGQQTLSELYKVDPELEVLVSSGYGEEQAMRLFAGQRVSGFIQKPYSSAQLLEKVGRALRRNRPGSGD